MSHHNNLNLPIDVNDTWNLTLPQYTSRITLETMICQRLHKRPACIQIMPVLRSIPPVIYYESCSANLYAAIRRQVTAVPEPSDQFLDKLETFFYSTIYPEWVEILENFHYSYEVWFNHLDKTQQSRVLNIDFDKMYSRYADIFCKGEKQETTYTLIEQPIDLILANDREDLYLDYPKTRAISALCEMNKYVMGPVIYALEQYSKNAKGYCGGKSWNELGQMYDVWYMNNWNTLIQTDISGMDRSIKGRLINLSFAIYELLTPKIHHVPIDVWKFHAFASQTQIKATIFDKTFSKTGTKIDLGNCLVNWKVFSGMSATTWLNSFVEIVIKRYVYENLLNLDKNSYGLCVKGDDSVAAVPAYIERDRIVEAFRQSYYFADLTKHYLSPLYMRHGSGLTLKFLSISDTLTDSDFISTHCYYCYNCKKHRFTRKIDRFISLTPWSTQAINLNDKNRLKYYQDLYVANGIWCRNLPIFHELNSYLYTGVKGNFTKNTSKSKMKLPLNDNDKVWQDKMFNLSDEEKLRKLLSTYERSFAYTQFNFRDTSISQCCADSYKLWLMEKMKLSENEITTIQKQLLNIRTEVYDCDLLTVGLYNLKKHFENTQKHATNYIMDYKLKTTKQQSLDCL